MKSKLCLFLALILIFSMSSCGKSDESNQSDTPDIKSEISEYPEPTPPENPDVTEPTNPSKTTAGQSGDWSLILVNKSHPLENEIDMTLTKIYGDYKADSRIVDAFKDMSAAAKDSGIDLVVHSAYRSISKQQSLYTNKVNKYLSSGYSEEGAKEAALSIVAYPGQSEHHTGLCLDITSSQWLVEHGSDPLISGFSDSESGKWLKENAATYGFILRYPLGKEDVTGYSFEPWHFRYVGTDAAQYIYQNDLTLEEYLVSLGL